MAKGINTGAVVDIFIGGFFLIVAILLIPRVLNQIAQSNAAIQRANSPGAAGDSALARIIGSAGDVGVGLVDKWGGNLLGLGPDPEE